VDRETELLVNCARVHIDQTRAETITLLVAQDLNWERLLKLAQRNGLIPLFFHHLNQICPAAVPPRHFNFLRDYFQKNSAFNLLLSGELLRLLKSFEAGGVSAVAYKGPATARKIYGNISLRQFGDLDVLVREADVWRASELLVAAGFEPHFVIPGRKREAFLRLSYVSLFRRQAGRLMVELHWRIAPGFFSVRFNTAALWPRLDTVEIQGADVSVPAAEDLLLMLSVHGAKDCWEKLEWVTCVAELINGTPSLDWQVLWRRSQEIHCEQMLLLALLLAHDLLDAPLPAEALDRIRKSSELATIAKAVTQDFLSEDLRPRTLPFRLRFHLALKDTASDKLRHCVRLAMTTTPVDWAMTPLPRSLSFIYPLLRAVRLTRKYALDAERAPN
jgi:hypothetical protein